MTNAKDLTKVAPRSAKERLGGFAVIARTIDKCRAHIAGTIGEYHFDCPVDNMLFGFMGTDSKAFRDYVATGASDDEIVAWVRANGAPKTDEEIKVWGDQAVVYNPISNPAKADWYAGECRRLGLDPRSTPLFDMLDIDDKVTFPNPA
jgi:hypothetical protein